MAAMIHLSILVILLSFQLSAAVSTLSGWEPINDLADPTVVRIAKFVVTTYNNERVNEKIEYKLFRVVKGFTQVAINGTNYTLSVHARAFIGGVEQALVARLVAIVYKRSDGKELKVISIKRLIQD